MFQYDYCGMIWLEIFNILNFLCRLKSEQILFCVNFLNQTCSFTCTSLYFQPVTFFLLISHLNIIWMYNATTHQWDTCICEYCMILTKWYKQERKESAIKFNDLYFSLCALSQWYFHNVYWMGGGGGRRKHIWSIKNEKKNTYGACARVEYTICASTLTQMSMRSAI